jgi:glycine/D-amino acid oxidase-like deaminating enzyme
MKVVVIGAGVIGAAVARALARGGADVTVLDAGGAAASPASFGWINASFYHNAAHHHLRAAGIAAYGRLLEAGHWPVAFSGALWWEEQGTALDAMAQSLGDLGYRVEQVDRAELRAVEPALVDPPQVALRFPWEGVAETAAFTTALLEDAKAADAAVIGGARALSIVTQGDAVTAVRTDMGDIAADSVVVAAGNGAPDILASVGVALPMLSRPGVIVTTRPVAARLSSVLVTPQGEVRQLPDGRLLSPAAANHQGDTAEAITEPLEEIAACTAMRCGRLIGQPDLGWEDVRVAYRPVPQDGLPVIGPAGPDGLHVAVMHSGVTLAAITAEVTAAQLLGQMTNAQADLIAPYDPMRFT